MNHQQNPLSIQEIEELRKPKLWNPNEAIEVIHRLIATIDVYRGSNGHKQNPQSVSLFPGFDETDAVRRVFAYFVEITDRHPKLYTLTPKRELMGKARFHDCLKKTGGNPSKAEEMMRLVVDTLNESDFHSGRGQYQGKTKYNDWKHIFASTDKLEEWIERSR